MTEKWYYLIIKKVRDGYMNSKVKNMIMAAMVAALCCVATMLVKIPSPLGGYLNAGDCVVLVAGFLFSPVYAFLAAGIGSGLADVFAGYTAYVPATFIIKGLMALIALFVFRLLIKKQNKVVARIAGAVLAEAFMVAGYLVFEGAFLYGFVPSLVNVIPNVMQGLAGIVLGLILTGIFEKYKITH